jgi:glucose/arabinose dehydrogenase
LLAATIFLLSFVSIGYFVGRTDTDPFSYNIPYADATITEDAPTDDATAHTDFSYESEVNDQPVINDPNLEVKQVAEGLQLPTSMAFLGPNDILVLEKDKGTVQRILNGKIMPEPLLDVNVATNSERGMLGIAAAVAEKNPVLDSKPPSSPSITYVFILFTESGSEEDGNDGCTRPSPNCNQISPTPNGNRLYRYELVGGDKLVNPVLLLDLPSIPGPAHNGGAITIGPDNNVYIPIGDVKGEDPQKIQSLDGRAGILRITQNGEAVVALGGAEKEGEGEDNKSIPESEDASSFSKYYYAYGIRNSFGIDFDPITGKLWDTENGPSVNDEINLVEPGFNSGWKEITGIASLDPGFDPDTDLENFDGKGKYSDPEFTWSDTVGPTAIKFLNSDKLGTQYQNDMFVGDVHRGNLYHFKLNKDRTGLALDGTTLADTIANDDTELSTAIFGKGFGGITDIELGPDGYPYVVSIGLGKIFKIVPKVNDNGEEVE